MTNKINERGNNDKQNEWAREQWQTKLISEGTMTNKINERGNND